MGNSFAREKRIPKHGDENFLTEETKKVEESRVKKESPNMGTKTSLCNIVNGCVFVKKESPNMGTKTSVPCYFFANRAIVKKESPNMGTKTFTFPPSMGNSFPPVKKESPNMGTKTYGLPSCRQLK